MNRTRIRIALNVASLVIASVPLIWFLANVGHLPDTVAVHFGINNVPNRWGSKWEYIAMPIVCLATTVFCLFTQRHTWLAHTPGIYTHERKVFVLTLLTLGAAITLCVVSFWLFYLGFSN